MKLFNVQIIALKQTVVLQQYFSLFFLITRMTKKYIYFKKNSSSNNVTDAKHGCWLVIKLICLKTKTVPALCSEHGTILM